MSEKQLEYQILDWDSNFFGFSVARINNPNLAKEKLVNSLSDLSLKGIKLIYWPASNEYSENEITDLGGSLVDLKTTFKMDFDGVNPEDFISTDEVEAYSDSMPFESFEELAVQSGEYSRFAVDPRIPREKFFELYRIWIARSLKKEIAREVLVLRESNRVVGMVTLGEKDGRGDIGLIAVDASSRGKSYGEKLVRSAQRWFIKNGYTVGQVVTQGNNIPPCMLYKKCGYSVEKVEYFYHFWR